MKSSLETITDLMNDMADPKGFHYQIIANIVGNDKKKIRAVISEIAANWLEKPKEIEKRMKSKDFRYYFVGTVLNQVKSKTSPLYKNYIKTNADIEIFDTLELEQTDDIEEKREREKRLIWLEGITTGKNTNVKMTWFEMEMFKLYYVEGFTYRQIQDEWGVNFLTAYNAVKTVVEKIKKEL